MSATIVPIPGIVYSQVGPSALLSQAPWRIAEPGQTARVTLSWKFGSSIYKACGDEVEFILGLRVGLWQSCHRVFYGGCRSGDLESSRMAEVQSWPLKRRPANMALKTDGRFAPAA
jgi:hypothetical protein